MKILWKNYAFNIEYKWKYLTNQLNLLNFNVLSLLVVVTVAFFHNPVEIQTEEVEVAEFHEEFSYILDKERVPPYNNSNDNLKVKDILPREFIPENISIQCRSREIGPFIALSTPINGVGNQFHYIQGALVLLAEFEGTIVLPRYVSTRKPLKKGAKDHEWEWVPMEDLFDVSYLVGYWRNRGKNICQQSNFVHYLQPDLRAVSFTFNDYRGVLKNCQKSFSQCFLKKLKYWMKNEFEIIHQRHYIYLPNIWGVNPVSVTVDSTEDPRLKRSIEVALSMRFSKKLVDIGHKIYRELKTLSRNRGLQNVTVIHLRVETDWQKHMKVVYPKLIKRDEAIEILSELLAFYSQRFIDYPPTGLVYLAMGKLNTQEQRVVDHWAKREFGDRWLTKHSLKAVTLLKGLSADQRGVIDCVAAVNAERFIGQGTSSMGYLISEIRGFLNKDSGMALGYGGLFRPMFATRKLAKVLIDPLE